MKIFKLVGLSFFFLFFVFLILNTSTKFGIVKHVVPQIFETIFLMTYAYVLIHSVKMKSVV